ncbi:MAG TPA: flippase [Nitrospirota bacterium]|nr:flippase [Nitrospirota bacterium]
MVHPFTQNITVQITGKVVSILAVIGSTALIARELGPVYFGYYSIILVNLSFITVLNDLGLQTIAVRNASQDAGSLGTITGNLFWIKVVLSCIVIALFAVLLTYSHYSPVVKRGVLLASIGAFFLSVISAPNTIFQSTLKLRYMVLSDICGQIILISLIGLICLFFAGDTHVLYYFIEAGVFSSLLSLCVALYYARRIERVRWNLNMALIGGLLRNTAPLALINLLSQVHFRGDSLLLSFMKTESDVGLYAIAYKFFESSLMVPIIIMTAVFPLLSRAHEDPGQLQAIAGKSFNWLLLTGAVASIGTFSLAPQLIEWTVGKNYHETILLLRILSPAILFSFINSIFANIVIAKNKQRDILFVSISGVTINLGLNAIFIPRYSAIACATITDFSECYGMLMMGYLAYRSSGFIPFRRKAGLAPL